MIFKEVAGKSTKSGKTEKIRSFKTKNFVTVRSDLRSSGLFSFFFFGSTSPKIMSLCHNTFNARCDYDNGWDTEYWSELCSICGEEAMSYTYSYGCGLPNMNVSLLCKNCQKSDSPPRKVCHLCEFCNHCNPTGLWPRLNLILLIKLTEQNRASVIPPPKRSQFSLSKKNDISIAFLLTNLPFELVKLIILQIPFGQVTCTSSPRNSKKHLK